MGGNQIARLDDDNVKTEQPVKETRFQPESQIQNTDAGASHQDEVFAATSTAEQRQPKSSEPSRTSARSRKQPDRFGKLISTTLL